MKIEIIGAESLGVRGLCCLVDAGGRRIVIDPGISLGFIRHRLLPHPVQIAAGQTIRQRIVDAVKSATDLVISHFHGDHIPLNDANPFQLSVQQLKTVPENMRAHPFDPSNDRQKQR